MPPVRSKPIREEQHDEDDQDHADDTDAAVTVAAEAATEAPKLEDDEYDDEYEFYLPLQHLTNIEPLRTPTVKPSIKSTIEGRHPGIVELLLLDGNAALVDVDLDTSSLLPLLIIQIA
jgi:hypothetical protein